MTDHPQDDNKSHAITPLAAARDRIEELEQRLDFIVQWFRSYPDGSDLVRLVPSFHREMLYRADEIEFVLQGMSYLEAQDKALRKRGLRSTPPGDSHE